MFEGGLGSPPATLNLGEPSDLIMDVSCLRRSLSWDTDGGTNKTPPGTGVLVVFPLYLLELDLLTALSMMANSVNSAPALLS